MLYPGALQLGGLRRVPRRSEEFTAEPRPVRKSLTVVGERIIYELRGIATIDLETVPARRKGCAVTRMFSSRVDDLATVEQAIASHASRLGEKLRREGLGTHVTVFFHTSEHDRGARNTRPRLWSPCPRRPTTR